MIQLACPAREHVQQDGTTLQKRNNFTAVCTRYTRTHRGYLPRETTDATAGRAVVHLRPAGAKLSLLGRGAHIAQEGVILTVAARVAPIVVVREVLFGW